MRREGYPVIGVDVDYIDAFGLQRVERACWGLLGLAGEFECVSEALCVWVCGTDQVKEEVDV